MFLQNGHVTTFSHAVYILHNDPLFVLSLSHFLPPSSSLFLHSLPLCECGWFIGRGVCVHICIQRKDRNREKTWKPLEGIFKGHFQDSVSIPPTRQFPPTPRSERTEIVTAYHWAQGHKAVPTENPEDSNTQSPECSFWRSLPVPCRCASCPLSPHQ